MCDFAEYYQIYNWRELPLTTAAALAFGLPDNSRCKRLLSNLPCDFNTLLLAMVVDHLKTLIWMQTEDAQKGENRPTSITQALLGIESDQNEVTAFASIEDFNRARANILGGA